MKKIAVLFMFLGLVCFVLPSPVFSASLTVTPTTINLYEGTQSTVTITGGTPPYSASSDDDTVARIVILPFIVGNTMGTVTGEAGGTATLTITDNAFNTVTIDVSVTGQTKTDTPASTLSKVYRFYSVTNEDHFYTIDEIEKDFIIANPSWGYVYEGIAWWAYKNEQQ